MNYQRTLEIERGDVDSESGTFRAALFTDGEATDGHILNIDGGLMPERIPLFVNHQAAPRTQLGSIVPDGRTEHALMVRGEILTTGEGAEAEIRRDILAKIQAGHVSRMSGRWDAEPEATRPRTSLPADHFAHIPETAKGPKRHGSFFSEWRAMEGSIVGLNADPAATMRWAAEASSPAVADFWRSNGADTSGLSAAFAAQCREMIAGGLSVKDLLEVLVSQEGAGESLDYFAHPKTLERLEALEAELASFALDVKERVSVSHSAEWRADPLPAVSPGLLARVLESELQKARQSVLDETRAYINRRRGRISHG